MARLPSLSLTAALGAAQLATLVNEHWKKLSDREREEMRSLVRKAGKRPDRNLTKGDQDRLRALVGKLEVVNLLKKAGPTVAGLRRKGT